jgi:hypothetical protein
MGIMQLQTIRHTLRLVGLGKCTIEVMPAHFQQGKLPAAHCLLLTRLRRGKLPIAHCLLFLSLPIYPQKAFLLKGEIL